MKINAALLMAMANGDGASSTSLGLTFWAPLGDLGAGVVDLTLARGSGVATFSRASTARTILANGLIGSVGVGSPRSCYSPTGQYLGFLCELGSTNLCLQSEDLTNASWAKGASTISANSTAAPDGAATADKIQEDNTNAVHFVTQPLAKSALAITYSVTVYLKQAERTFAFLQCDDGAGNGALVYFNLVTGAISTAAAGIGAGPFTGISATPAVQAGNGFWRCNLNFTSNAVGTLTIAYGPVAATGTQAYVGTTGSGIFAWGAQVEAAVAASSYIPTVAATISRLSDVLTYPGGGGNVTAAVGTLGLETTVAPGPAGTLYSASISDASVNNRVSIFETAANANANYRVTSGAVAQLANTGLNNYPAAGVLSKQAIRWSVADATAYLNGVLDRTTGAITPPAALTQINVAINETAAGNQLGATCKNLRVWNRALTDAELISVTR